MAVSVRAPDGRGDQTAFAITVTGPRHQIAFDLGGGLKLELVRIPPGEFLMGSPDSDYGGRPQERPQHRVRITKPFYMGNRLVTQEQWQAVMGYNNSRDKDPKYPVEIVSWNECQTFVKKLGAKFGTGKARFALPTEAQWEYACRAGTTTPYFFGEDPSYFFGDDGRQMEHYACGYGENRPPSAYWPNPWGLYDMYSLWQWCEDCHTSDYDKALQIDDPTGPSGSDGLRMVRGGYPWRSARRDFYDAALQGNIALRVCLLKVE